MNHYFDSHPESEETVTEVIVRMDGMELPFLSASGMFSVGKLDKGAHTLIKHAHIQNNQRVLDLGCSYGVVGICLAKQMKIDVTLVDINQRAIKYARMNAKRNNVQATIKVSDGFKNIEKQFDVILFNPPQHAGKKLCMDLISQAKNHLAPNGSLQVVCRHNKGGATFEAHMQEIYNNVETLVKTGGYRIYKSTKQQS
jgi:16S rRNA (guanine1207-N2)-methyltransferase